MKMFCVRMARLVFGVALLIGISPPAQAINATQQMEFLLQTIENSYGPLAHKEDYLGWSWQNFRAERLQEARVCANSRDYYSLATQTLRSLKDAHVSVSLPSSLEASLPVQLVPIGKDLLVGHLSEKATDCSAEPGDVVVAIDGVTPERLVADRIIEKSVGNAGADLMLTVVGFSRRSEARGDFGLEALRGRSARLEFRRANEPRTLSCDLTWKVVGHSMIDRRLNKGAVDMNAPLVVPQTLASTPKFLESLGEYAGPAEKKLMPKQERRLDRLASLIRKIHEFADLQTNILSDMASADGRGVKLTLGQAKPHYPLPKGFKRISLPVGLSYLIQDNLYAGTFLHQGKKVGYLRIGSYAPKLPEYAIFGLRQVFAKLELNSDYLIIDQTFNPGGYVFYADMVVRALVGDFDDQKHMRFAFKPTQKKLKMADTVSVAMDAVLEEANQDERDWVQGNERLQRALTMCREDFATLRDAYQANRDLSAPIRLYSTSIVLEELVEHAITKVSIVGKLLDLVARAKITKAAHYTKPVFVVTNELDFSGADAAPAMLQDYGRVRIIGMPTAGAGGSVGEYSLSAGEPFEFSLTESLMVRPGGKLVENYGVQPDAPFTATVADVADGYSGYFGRILELVQRDLSARLTP